MKVFKKKVMEGSKKVLITEPQYAMALTFMLGGGLITTQEVKEFAKLTTNEKCKDGIVFTFEDDELAVYAYNDFPEIITISLSDAIHNSLGVAVYSHEELLEYLEEAKKCGFSYNGLVGIIEDADEILNNLMGVEINVKTGKVSAIDMVTDEEDNEEEFDLNTEVSKILSDMIGQEISVVRKNDGKFYYEPVANDKYYTLNEEQLLILSRLLTLINN
jgi:hypothetical protein